MVVDYFLSNRLKDSLILRDKMIRIRIKTRQRYGKMWNTSISTRSFYIPFSVKDID